MATAVQAEPAKYMVQRAHMHEYDCAQVQIQK